jgi:hypothetical protein
MAGKYGDVLATQLEREGGRLQEAYIDLLIRFPSRNGGFRIFYMDKLIYP